MVCSVLFSFAPAFEIFSKVVPGVMVDEPGISDVELEEVVVEATVKH